MKENWIELSDDDLESEIDWTQKMLRRVVIYSLYPEETKERLTNQYLEKLKELYDEKRKRADAGNDSE